jgi:hypothetical protein
LILQIIQFIVVMGNLGLVLFQFHQQTFYISNVGFRAGIKELSSALEFRHTHCKHLKQNSIAFEANLTLHTAQKVLSKIGFGVSVLRQSIVLHICTDATQQLTVSLQHCHQCQSLIIVIPSGTPGWQHATAIFPEAIFLKLFTATAVATVGIGHGGER